MSGFHVGQMVVCVDAEGTPLLEHGRIYTVSAIGPFCGRIMMDVAEVAASSVPFAWWTSRFRPVKETSIEIFRKLVAPMPFSAWQTGERVKNYE